MVEKCLKLGGAGLNEQRDAVVQELMTSPNLGRLLQVRGGVPAALRTLLGCLLGCLLRRPLCRLLGFAAVPPAALCTCWAARCAP